MSEVCLDNCERLSQHPCMLLAKFDLPVVLHAGKADTYKPAHPQFEDGSCEQWNAVSISYCVCSQKSWNSACTRWQLLQQLSACQVRALSQGSLCILPSLLQLFLL